MVQSKIAAIMSVSTVMFVACSKDVTSQVRQENSEHADSKEKHENVKITFVAPLNALLGQGVENTGLFDDETSTLHENVCVKGTVLPTNDTPKGTGLVVVKSSDKLGGLSNLSADKIFAHFPLANPKSQGKEFEIFSKDTASDEKSLTTSSFLWIHGGAFALTNPERLVGVGPCGERFVHRVYPAGFLAFAFKVTFENEYDLKQFNEKFHADTHKGSLSLFDLEDETAKEFLVEKKAKVSIQILQGGGDAKSTETLVADNECSAKNIEACKKVWDALKNYQSKEFPAQFEETPLSLKDLGPWGVYGFSSSGYGGVFNP